MMGHNLRLRLIEYERDVHCATLSGSSSSKTSTFTPCLESSNATSRPAGPAPATATEGSMKLVNCR